MRKKVKIPILIIHNKQDNISCYKSVINFFNNINSKDKELFLLDDGNHTLLVPKCDNDYQPIVVLSKITN